MTHIPDYKEIRKTPRDFVRMSRNEYRFWRIALAARAFNLLGFPKGSRWEVFWDWNGDFVYRSWE